MEVKELETFRSRLRHIFRPSKQEKERRPVGPYSTSCKTIGLTNWYNPESFTMGLQTGKPYVS